MRSSLLFILLIIDDAVSDIFYIKISRINF